jgi:hypothetical protein
MYNDAARIKITSRKCEYTPFGHKVLRLNYYLSLSKCWAIPVEGDLKAFFTDPVLQRKTPSFGILRHVVFLRTDVSEERSTFIIRVTRISELGTSAVTSNRRMLQRSHIA